MTATVRYHCKSFVKTLQLMRKVGPRTTEQTRCVASKEGSLKLINC